MYQWNSFLPGVLQCFNISHHNVVHIGSVSVVHYDVCVNETMQETLMLKTLLITCWKKAQTLSKYCCTIAMYKECLTYTEIPNSKHNYFVNVMNDVPVYFNYARKLFLSWLIHLKLECFAVHAFKHCWLVLIPCKFPNCWMIQSWAIVILSTGSHDYMYPMHHETYMFSIGMSIIICARFRWSWLVITIRNVLLMC